MNVRTTAFLAILSLSVPIFAAHPIDENCRNGYFERGNANNDAYIDVSDAVWILLFLFTDQKEPDDICECGNLNVDNDTRLHISDVAYLLEYLYNAGPQPPAPWQTLGFDGSEPWFDCWSQDEMDQIHFDFPGNGFATNKEPDEQIEAAGGCGNAFCSTPFDSFDYDDTVTIPRVGLNVFGADTLSIHETVGCVQGVQGSVACGEFDAIWYDKDETVNGESGSVEFTDCPLSSWRDGDVGLRTEITVDIDWEPDTDDNNVSNTSCVDEASANVDQFELTLDGFFNVEVEDEDGVIRTIRGGANQISPHLRTNNWKSIAGDKIDEADADPMSINLTWNMDETNVANWSDQFDDFTGNLLRVKKVWFSYTAKLIYSGNTGPHGNRHDDWTGQSAMKLDITAGDWFWYAHNNKPPQ